MDMAENPRRAKGKRGRGVKAQVYLRLIRLRDFLRRRALRRPSAFSAHSSSVSWASSAMMGTCRQRLLISGRFRCSHTTCRICSSSGSAATCSW